MREDMPKDVPFIVHEGAMARNERLVKRLIISLAISIILMFLSNAIWIYEWTQYDYSSDSISLDSQDGGNASYIGSDGNIYNGESGSKNPKTNTEK